MTRTLHLLATASVAALALSSPLAAQENKTDPIKISIISSTDGDFLAYAYGGVLEEFGYNVKYVRVDYTAQLAALETGDLDVTTSIWDSTGWDNLIAAVQGGKVVNHGSTGVTVQEGWWYPDYLTESCPGLPDWTALKEPACVEALSTVETEPYGRFIDAPADWETDTQGRAEALGLELEAINSGSPVTMAAAMQSAVDKKEPVIGWGFVPHWFFQATPGGFVDLPAHDDACYDDPAWGVNPDMTLDCGFASGFVWKLGTKGFNDRAPNAARLLHVFNVSTADVSEATDLVDNKGEDLEDVAKAWVEDHRAEWSGWLR